MKTLEQEPMKKIKLTTQRALVLLGTLSVLGAEEETEYRLGVNNYNYLGAGYSYRDLRAGTGATPPAEDSKSGRLQEGAVTFSKEWTLRSDAGSSIGVVVAPTVSYAVASYSGGSDYVSTMDFGGRVGLKLNGFVSKHSKTPIGFLLFTDASWQRDDVQGMNHKYGMGLEPGFQLSYQFAPRVGAAFEYKYVGLSDVTRVENFSSNELRLIGLFSMTKNLGLEVGAILNVDHTDYQAVGGFVGLRRGF